MTDNLIVKNPHPLLSGVLRYLSFILGVGLFAALLLEFHLTFYKAYFLIIEIPVFIFFTFASYKKIYSRHGCIFAFILFLVSFLSFIFDIVTSPYGLNSVGLTEYVALFISLSWLLLLFKFRGIN